MMPSPRYSDETGAVDRSELQAGRGVPRGLLSFWGSGPTAPSDRCGQRPKRRAMSSCWNGDTGMLACEAGARRVSQARGGQAFAGDTANMVTRSGNSQQFLEGVPLGLVMQPTNLYVCSIELRPNDLASPHTSRRTDEFIQNSSLNQLSRQARPPIHTYLTKRRVT